MTVILKQIFQLLKLLNSETGTHQIAWGVALGFVLGMTPVFSLQTVLVILLLLFLRVQIGAALLAAFGFKFIAYLLDPVFHEVGHAVLSNAGLKPTFTTLYNMPIVPWTRFYNTIVMGSGVLSLALTPVVFFASLFLIKKYRKNVYEKIRHSKIMKAIKATGFYKLYMKYEEFYG